MDTSQRTLILDVDGTLVDSTYHHAIAWGKAFRACELEVPMWRIHRSIGMGGDRLVTAVSGDDVEERLGDRLRDLWRVEYDKLVEEVVPLPGAHRFVEGARRDGYRVCVASSGNRSDTDTALGIAHVADLIGTVVTGDDVDSSKPSPEIFEVAWQRTGGGAALVVGDSVYDVESASKLGLPCVTVRTGGFAVRELEEAGAILVVDDLTDLVDRDLSDLYR
jgi:HAD superfamily hydrolase (TIGR01549 family)